MGFCHWRRYRISLGGSSRFGDWILTLLLRADGTQVEGRSCSWFSAIKSSCAILGCFVYVQYSSWFHQLKMRVNLEQSAGQLVPKVLQRAVINSRTWLPSGLSEIWEPILLVECGFKRGVLRTGLLPWLTAYMC